MSTSGDDRSPEGAGWAARAEFALVMRHEADADAADAAIQRALRDIDGSGQSADDALGDPDEWADAQAAQWREDAAPVFETGPTVDLRTFLIGVPAGATVLSVLFFVVELIQDGLRMQHSLMSVLFPLLLSVLMLILIAVYERIEARAGMLIAGAVCVVLGLAGASLIALAAAFGNIGFGEASTFWGLALVAGYALLTAVVSAVVLTLIPAPESRSAAAAPVGPLSDADWEKRFLAAARRRRSVREAQRTQALAEARTHVAETGASMQEEFGSPEGYAQRLIEEPGLAKRRTSLIRFIALLGIGGVLISTAFSDGSPSVGEWVFIGLWVLLVVLGVGEQIRHRREAREGKDKGATGRLQE
ncbi:hypothetical protein [Helcobacillus massiliensis]|uniref:Uncharacterized protein n=1 Tax=Helcobacillus massiliensis TaxID=521392 RepID=A0A839QYM1_9MICO|nr:hypothetical protein [Helcobacillus massiliensis]MBB3023051.1 hypothetical protein [Helcobacillus massiliensis]